MVSLGWEQSIRDRTLKVFQAANRAPLAHLFSHDHFRQAPVETSPSNDIDKIEKRQDSSADHPLKNLFKLFLLLFVIVFIMHSSGFGPTAKLTCERRRTDGSVNCINEKSLFLLIPLGRKFIQGVQGAILTTSENDDGYLTYRVELLTDHGTVPLTSAYLPDWDSKYKIVEQINTFIDSSTDDRLVVVERGLLSTQNAGFTIFVLVWILIWLLISASQNQRRRQVMDELPPTSSQ